MNYLKTDKGFHSFLPNILLIEKGSVITDTKELQILKTCHHKIEQNAFDEKDIYSFLNLIKKLAKKDTPTFELGDFIAQREKYRGPINTYLLDAKAKLDKSVKEKAALALEPIYSFDEIAQSINDIMVLHKLSNLKDLDFYDYDLPNDFGVFFDYFKDPDYYLTLSNKEDIAEQIINLYIINFQRIILNSPKVLEEGFDLYKVASKYTGLPEINNNFKETQIKQLPFNSTTFSK